MLYIAAALALAAAPAIWLACSLADDSQRRVFAPVERVRTVADVEPPLSALATRDPMALVRLGQERYDRDIREYRCVLLKQERLDAALTSVQEIEVRFRASPHTVYMLWRANADQVKRALFIDDGQNIDKDGHKQARVEPAGAILNFFVKDIYMPIDGAEARKSSRRTIDECGFRSTFSLLEKYNGLAAERGELFTTAFPRPVARRRSVSFERAPVFYRVQVRLELIFPPVRGHRTDDSVIDLGERRDSTLKQPLKLIHRHRNVLLPFAERQARCDSARYPLRRCFRYRERGRKQPHPAVYVISHCRRNHIAFQTHHAPYGHAVSLMYVWGGKQAAHSRQAARVSQLPQSPFFGFHPLTDIHGRRQRHPRLAQLHTVRIDPLQFHVDILLTASFVRTSDHQPSPSTLRLHLELLYPIAYCLYRFRLARRWHYPGGGRDDAAVVR